ACLKDAPLILLDEATRNVDWENDYLLQQALARLCRGKTVIAIAHRLQTLAGMDKLLVLEQGSIAHFGPLHELYKQPDAVSRLLGNGAACLPAPTAIERAAIGPALAGPPREPMPEMPSPPSSAPPGAPLARMLKLCRHYAALITGSCILSASAIAANIALLGFSSYLISRASLAPPLLDLMTVIVAVRFFGISRAILRYAERYVSHDVTLRILSKLRLWYYDHMEKLSYVSLQKLGLGRVFKHIINDVDILKFFYLRVLTIPVQALLIWAASALFLSFFSWKLTIILSAFFLCGGIICPYLMRRLLSGARGDFDLRRQSYSETLYDYINGQADRQICGDTPQQLRIIEDQGRLLMRERYYIGVWDSFAAVLTSLLANLALFAALTVMIELVAGNKANALLLASVIWVMWASFEALQPVAVMMEYLNQSRGALAGMEEAAARPREPRREGNSSVPSSGGLRVENLSFAYEESRPLLTDITFTLKPGSKTALLGSSGAGKTTLLNILIGFLPYEKGHISSGEIELKQVEATHLRQHIGYLEQRPYLFHASIRENILMAKENATEQELRAAAAKARLDEFIDGLPANYDTIVGENGYKLSAGQRQRLALARLFLQDAPLILLDEATQSLDTKNRDSIFETLSEWWNDKTVLYVTHDSHGLAAMDNILVMERGRLVEQGSEDALLKAGGHYARMFAIEHSFF
ncbi:MAG: thiol reductant ABC exporter subunit CydC, partial [Clostridiales bacterium]|nr:thiol reductant ABC exporter subunit CydC [Clostridiales bacterium]